MAAGQLEKMRIQAFTADDFKTEVVGEYYDVLVNPESYAISYEVKTNDINPPGGGPANQRFDQIKGQKMSFKFLFDGTGVIRSGSGPGGLNITPAMPNTATKRDVVVDIEKFKNVVYHYDGKIHQPRYVRLEWGVLHYNCRLQSMDITYKLFKPDGYPLRAEANCTFTSVLDQVTSEKIKKKESPDITKIHTVVAGDTLPLLCFREYGNSKYYYQVARYNKLTNLKRLNPGDQIIFPPIAK